MIKVRVTNLSNSEFIGWLVTALDKPQLNGFKLFKDLYYEGDYVYVADRQIKFIEILDWSENV